MSEDVPRYGAPLPARAPGELTNEFRALIAALGWSQRETAEAIGMDSRSVRRWAAADPEPPLTAVYALRYLALVQAERAVSTLTKSCDAKATDEMTNFVTATLAVRGYFDRLQANDESPASKLLRAYAGK